MGILDGGLFQYDQPGAFSPLIDFIFGVPTTIWR